MSNITVIIPLHEFNEEIETLLINAVNSVPQDKEIRISCKNGIAKDLKKVGKMRKNIIIFESENTDAPSDFASLVTQAIEDTEYFSILEFDDTYTNIWFDNVEKYMKWQPETSVFLPMCDLVNYADNKFVGFGNEAPWASSFSNEIGVIDHDCLQDFFDFYLTGSVFNTKDWIECGGLKSSMKVSFWYEFLLRLTHNNKKIFVIPKIGYVHCVNRPTSLYVQYRDEISKEESTWWFELAKQEYVFKIDRNKVYSVNNEDEKGE